MRLDRYLSNAGIGTRKEVKKLIKDGKVSVGDLIIKESDYQVTFNSKVHVLNQLINYKEYYYLLLNKPKGYISATEDNYHKVVLDLVEDYKKYHIAPVGRLDIDTTGVMLLTNHGSLAHSLLSPKSHVSKTYVAEVNHPLSKDLIGLFSTGVTLNDGYKCLPAQLKIIDNLHAELTIHEGKFHQVKRMFLTFGYEVINLERTKFDDLTCKGLSQGEYRELNDEEITHLLNHIK